MKNMTIAFITVKAFLLTGYITPPGKNKAVIVQDASFQENIAFHATISSNIVEIDPTRDNVVPFTIATYNIGNSYSTQTRTFTAPVTGIYHFEMTVDTETNSIKNGDMQLFLNPYSKCEVAYSMNSPTYERITFSLSCDIKLFKSATVIPTIKQTTGMTKKIYGNNPRTRFSGRLVMKI